MYYSVVLVALGFCAAGVNAEEPSWVKNYVKAREQGQKEQKPLAVVIGSGAAGWNKLSDEGRLEAKARRFLAAHYICVYVDTEHIDGQRLAADFEIPKGPGIIISDSAAHLQAFRHEGNLSSEKLLTYLRRYADPDRVVQVTESNPDGRDTQYDAGVESTNFRPFSALTQTFAPALAPRGGC